VLGYFEHLVVCSKIHLMLNLSKKLVQLAKEEKAKQKEGINKTDIVKLKKK
jgi:hypothetical protein